MSNSYTAIEGPPSYMTRKNTVDTLPPYEILKPEATLSPDREKQLSPHISSNDEGLQSIANPAQRKTRVRKLRIASHVGNGPDTSMDDTAVCIMVGVLLTTVCCIAVVTYLNEAG